MGPNSFHAFADRMGVDVKTINKAYRTGRLQKSVKRVGRSLVITDQALAEQEFRQNADAKGPTIYSPGSIARARERVLKAQAAKLEQETAIKAGELLPKRAALERWSSEVVKARTALLGLPTRAKQRIPHLTVAEIQILDDLVREALEELAT